MRNQVALITVVAVMADGTQPAHRTLQDAPDPGDLKRVAEEFGLGNVRDALFLANGRRNRSWRIDTATGVYALRLLRDVPVEIAHRNAKVLAALRPSGLPVYPPMNIRDGGPVLQIGAHSYLVSPWANGAHVEGTDLPLGEVSDFGALVATVHKALSEPERVSLPPADFRPRMKVTSPDKAIDKADRLLAAIASITEPSEFDKLARTLLEERKVLIDKHRGSPPVEGDDPGPFGWTHGDLQHRNILHSKGKVSAVLDWDRIAVRPIGEEITRTALVQFGGENGRLDLDRVAAFVGGYRSVLPLSRTDLADEVDRLWWKRMSDYWIFEFHYDRSDHDVDPLMAPSGRLLSWWTDRREDVHQAFAAGT
ncbi:phosphotransferase [Actinomadura vinacea]|uniref:Phosphotransferase n=1 Tax=Actinomadura vinacea TaxID=115336 RepID=A0ABN3I9M3_9ACTN